MTISRVDLLHRLLPIVAAQGCGLICGLLGVAAVSRWVTPADYGTYGVFITLATLGASVVYAGPLKFLGRQWADSLDRPSLLRATVVAVLRKTPWLLVACSAVTLVFSPDRKIVFAALLFVTAFLLTFLQLAQIALQAAREHWRDFGLSVVASLTRSFAPPLLYVSSGVGLVALLLGFLVHALVGALAGAAILSRWHGSRRAPPGPALPPIYAGPQFVALAAAAWILTGINRWIVVGFYGPETGGYFALATNVGAILPWMSGVVFLQYAQPQWFGAEPSTVAGRLALLRSVDRIALAHTATALALAAFVHAGMPWLTGTLVSPRYAEAAQFVFMAGCAAIPATTALYYHTLLVAVRREGACARADLGGIIGLILGSVATAAAGLTWFKTWLAVSILVPWIVNRTVARRALLHGG